jgi:NDP-sugar pyrophosphorylase family protein
MQAAILSAGLGTRISPHFNGLYKPMVPVAGMPMIEFQLRSIEYAGIDKVAILLRREYKSVGDYIVSLGLRVRLDVFFEDTCGGAYSLFALSDVLRRESDFFLFSVDSIFAPNSLKEFVTSRAGKTTPEIVTWVTHKSDQDTNYVGVVMSDKRVVDFGKHIQHCDYIAEGPFHCQISVLNRDLVREAGRKGIVGLSNYFSYLLSSGITLGGYMVDTVFDVDTPADAKRANSFLAGAVDTLRQANRHTELS